MNALELTGRSHSHIVECAEPSCRLHVHVLPSFLALRRAAAAEGIDLVAVSGFRDFKRQLAIWNAKYDGTTPMNDVMGLRIDAASLSPPDRVETILLWSALPGASRHHWGTDMDLIDRNALASGHRVQLVQSEFESGGPFAVMGSWLEANAQRYGFFRPFRGVRSGVRPEPWHFSFAPVADNARRGLTPAVLREAVEAAPLSGKEWVLERLEELHHRFVDRIDLP